LYRFREFTRDGNDVASNEVEELSKKQLFIIDGQQRMQSFYIGLCGSYKGKRMFFDLYSDYSDDEYEFKFVIEEKDLPKTNKERAETAVGDCLWYPASGLYDRLKDTNDDDQVAEEIIRKYTVDDDKKIKHIEKMYAHFIKGFLTQKALGFQKCLSTRVKIS